MRTQMKRMICRYNVILFTFSASCNFIERRVNFGANLVCSQNYFMAEYDTKISTPKQVTFYKTYNLGTTRNICDPDFMECRWIKRYVNT